jgi:hypothetical protein
MVRERINGSLQRAVKQVCSYKLKQNVDICQALAAGNFAFGASHQQFALFGGTEVEYSLFAITFVAQADLFIVRPYLN